MRKTIALCVSLAVLVAFMAPAAFGAVVGSRHDMADAGNTRVTLQNLNTFGTCSACHLPHGAGADRLFPSTVGGAGGFFGGLCGSCHSNAVIAGDVDLNFNVTVLAGHGLAIGTIQGNGDHETVGASGLQYVDAAGSPRTPQEAEIECLSCHDVHNQNGFRPFMAVDLDDLCEACHSNRVNTALGTTGFANNAGTSGSTHPSGGAFLGDVSGIANPGADSPFVASWGTEFTANVDQGAAGSTWEGGGEAPWDSGLQLENQAAAGAGSVDCISCHNVHWDEDDGVTPANDTAYLGITAEGTGGPANLFCEYCHQGDVTTASPGGYWWNPGAVGTFSHPNDDVGSTAVDSATFTSMPFGLFVPSSPRAGSGASGLVCTGCHGVHPGDSTAPETEINTPILLNYDETTFADVCDACHTGSTAFQHHPTGGTYDTAGNTAGNVTCAGGDVGNGVNACHGTAGANVAHNRTEPLNAPYSATRVCNDPVNQCQACHGSNPSLYTPTGGGYTADGEASHWVNETWVASGMGDNSAMCNGNAGIRYAGGGCSDGSAPDTWATSGLASLFPSADPDCLICESCHRLVVNNLNSGDGPGGTNMLVEVSGMAIDTIAESAAAPAPATSDYDSAPYICTGCHLVPGGTHPLLEADGTVFPIGAGAGFAYTTTGTNVNCESCHSPHDAETTSGSYILDASGAAYGAGVAMEVEPAIDYTSFCAVCHNTYQ